MNTDTPILGASTPEPTDVATPTPEVSKRHERWPYDDVKRIMRAGDYARGRNVALLLGCTLCEERIAATGMDGAGNTIVECACTRRVWER